MTGMHRLPTLSAAEIGTDRLRLRRAHDADVDGLIELLTDPQVRGHLGGPRPRSAVEQYFGETVARATARHMEYPYPDVDHRRIQI